MDRSSLARRYAARFLCAFALLVGGPAAAAIADEAGWAAAKRPGVAILMRHALAPGTGDPARFDLADCATQRNLSEDGRAQARTIGEAFRDRDVAVDLVLTSQWCRCRETAELLDLGPVEDFPPLNSFFQDRSTADAQTRETLDHLAGLPDDRRAVLVTHQVNISALTGVFPRSGEAVVVDVTPAGELAVLGRIETSP